MGGGEKFISASFSGRSGGGALCRVEKIIIRVSYHSPHVEKGTCIRSSLMCEYGCQQIHTGRDKRALYRVRERQIREEISQGT